MSEKTAAAAVEDRAEEDTKTEKNGETPRGNGEEQRNRGGGGGGGRGDGRIKGSARGRWRARKTRSRAGQKDQQKDDVGAAKGEDGPGEEGGGGKNGRTGGKKGPLAAWRRCGLALEKGEAEKPEGEAPPVRQRRGGGGGGGKRPGHKRIRG